MGWWAEGGGKGLDWWRLVVMGERHSNRLGGGGYSKLKTPPLKIA